MANNQEVSITAYVKDEGLREIGDLGLWSVSSFKPGYGPANLRDNDLTTFWQSDATQPQQHSVTVQFQRRVAISQLSFYVLYSEDESYTPSEVTVRAGSFLGQLTDIYRASLQEPSGWVNVSLVSSDEGYPLRTYILQLFIESNHQKGKDSHIRQVKVFTEIGQVQPSEANPDTLPFTSLEFHSHSTLR